MQTLISVGRHEARICFVKLILVDGLGRVADCWVQVSFTFRHLSLVEVATTRVIASSLDQCVLTVQTYGTL